MWRHFLVMSVCFGSFRAAEALEQKFPYRAAVISDKIEVRCGPGSQFYVTSQVNKSDVVTVQRHDHGGWFMIAPPKGSISWIDASLVKKTGGDRGVVQVAPQDGRPARAIVRIGSTVSKEHSYYGRELSNGDEVTIVGEETLNTARGAVRMLKIVPPAQEFRWMKGEFLVPQDEAIREQIAHDPYQVPAEHRPAFVNKKQEKAKVVEKAQQQEITRRQMLYDELDRIDRLYATMMQKEPADWDLAAIEKQYKTLSTGADSTIATLIQKRLDVLKRRNEILSHYQEFVQVSAESAQRDQELVAMQLGYQSQPNITPPGTMSTTQQPTQPGEALNSAVSPRLNGAGVIQPLQSYPGAPQFALVAPDGRMLAYLETAEGINIREWIGKPSGIIGNRQFNPQLGADVIRVQRVVPVKLVQ
ncbi:SH3 domain-containing protein [bacterium]|jgi:hypothetical protein|nr:SH3 domain-containing protein [Planctomicrobium sp.]MDA7527372.1 SH3 domain-containing protein [bacterium]